MDDHPFSPADDDFHAAPADEIWFTETSWFSFNVPERRMGCWLYAWARPNMRNSGGGVFVWDPSATEPRDAPYFGYQYTQPLPERLDLREFTFPNNYSVRMIEPLRRYALHFADRDLIRIDAEWTALTDPHPFAHDEPPFKTSAHFDQPGHVVGEMVLNGERITIDSYSVRDRSWGPRLDHRGNRIGYPFGVASDIAFCLFAIPNKDGRDRDEPINHGFLWADGEKRQIVKGVRHVERDKRENWPARMTIQAVDADGRRLEAIGEVESRLVMTVPRGLCINSSIRWSINGIEGYGEDQDVWRIDQWRAARLARGQIG